MLVRIEDLPEVKEVFEGRYLISRDARVFSRQYKHQPSLSHVWELWTTIETSGAERVALTVRGKFTRIQLQNLVALAFLPPRPTDKHVVGHLNGNRSDNRAENLAWIHQDELPAKFWALKNRPKLDVFSLN